MTVQETNEWDNYRAIDLLKRIKREEIHERYIDRHKAFDIAIQALEEIEQYRALGTVEEIEPYIRLAEKLNICDLVSENKRLSNKIQFLEIELKEAMEKQVAKKPLEKEVLFDGMKELACVCSVCESEIGLYKGQPYCENCGNRVDWEEGGTSESV